MQQQSFVVYQVWRRPSCSSQVLLLCNSDSAVSKCVSPIYLTKYKFVLRYTMLLPQLFCHSPDMLVIVFITPSWQDKDWTCCGVLLLCTFLSRFIVGAYGVSLAA